MKPVAIFQHSPTGPPDAVLDVLAELSLPWTLIPVMDGAPVPTDPAPWSAVVLMGGGMGVHDGLPWMAQSLDFLRRAAAAGVPVMGHCLGAQMLALALGGQVVRGARMEIGWQHVEFEGDTQAWFGLDGTVPASRGAEVFQWHEDQFSLPPGAQRLATNAACANQAFVWQDRRHSQHTGTTHVGMQFHLEMTAELIAALAHANRARHQAERKRGNPHANTHGELNDQLVPRTQRMHALLRAVYGRWARQLSSPAKL